MDFSANVRSVEVLVDLKTALGQFGSDLQQSLTAIAQEIVQVQQWLDERERYWQYQINHGSHHREAEQELYNVQRWKNAVELAALDYQRQAHKLASQLNYDVPKAGAFLERKIAELNAYLSTINQLPAYNRVATMADNAIGAVDFKKTQPTGDAGGKPIGNPAPETGSQKHTHQRENQAADILAAQGYQVEQSPSTLPNGKNPDYKIEGEYFDCFSPTSDNIDQVRWGISQKVNSGQTQRILLNLEDSRFEPSDIQKLLLRKPKKGLKEVIGIKGGKIIHIFP